jgi:phosphoglycerol transferase MdoB-like AlkP superfamily enzyme
MTALPRGWGIGPAMASCVLLALVVYGVFQRRGFEELLGLSRIQLAGEEPWLVPGTILSTTLIALLPGLAVAGVLVIAGRHRWSRFCFVACSSVALFLVLLDLDLLRSIGRHLTEVVEVALQPQGRLAAGDNDGSWAAMLVEWALVGTATSIVVTFAAEVLVAAAVARVTTLVHRTLALAGALAFLVVLAGPRLMHEGWRNVALYERTYGIMFLELKLADLDFNDFNPDPKLRVLYPRLRDAYRVAFPIMSAGKPGAATPIALPTRPPNVVLIVTESLRQDVFSTELMPRLTRWAQNGLVAPEHDSGTIYSQSGMFALLYGRSPAVFHQTLDAHVPPQMCVTLRASGYECAYFTGHPKVWMRREEFLNDQTMDHFVHDNRGTWPEWDQRALDGMVKMVSASEKPIFAIVLLMSSHFGYEYPAQYEIDLPVSKTAWHVTNVRSLGPEDEVPHRNRYRNSIRFIDDVVADAIDKLDPARNLVVFTGDHGESINDDGHYTHGHSFAEIVTHTPMAMVGPGVTQTRLDRRTLHVDLLPSLLHALSGTPQSLPHTHGIDWFGTERRSASFETHSAINRDIIQTQLRTNGLRLRLDLDLHRPELKLLGFEDVLGHLIPQPELDEAAVEGLGSALEAELTMLRR